MNHWFSDILTKGIQISGAVLKNKAEEFTRKFGRPEFMPTDGCLSHWKARHQIMFKRAHGKKCSTDTNEAEEWISMVLLQLLREYKSNNIYNADETGLY